MNKYVIGLTAAIGILLFQNCNKVKFSQGDLNPYLVGGFLVLKVDGASFAVLQVGDTYNLEVLASEDIAKQGLNPASSKLVKVGGSCIANNMQPWVLDASAVTEVAAVEPLLNDGLPFSGNIEIATPVIVEGLVLEPPLIELEIPMADSTILSQGSQTIAQKVSVEQGVLVNGEIDLGSTSFVYTQAMADRMAGCRWLGCVRSADSSQEACVELRTADAAPVSNITTSTPSTTSTLPPPVNCAYKAFTAPDQLGVTKCLASGTNGRCDVSFSTNLITELQSINASTVRSLILNHNFYTNTSSGNLVQNGVCADWSVDPSMSYSLRLKNDGVLVPARFGGSKYYYTDGSWTGTTLKIGSQPGGWGGSGGRGCVDKVKGFIEHGPADCRPCPIVPGVGPTCTP